MGGGGATFPVRMGTHAAALQPDFPGTRDAPNGQISAPQDITNRPPPPPARGSVDTTKTRSGPQGVRMSSGERPIGAGKGRQSDTEALCHPPPPGNKATMVATLRNHSGNSHSAKSGAGGWTRGGEGGGGWTQGPHAGQQSTLHMHVPPPLYKLRQSPKLIRSLRLL